MLRNQMEQIKKSLLLLPEKEKGLQPINDKAAYSNLAPTFEALRKKGYSMQEIAELVRDAGLPKATANRVETAIKDHKKKYKRKPLPQAASRAILTPKKSTDFKNQTAPKKKDNKRSETEFNPLHDSDDL